MLIPDPIVSCGSPANRSKFSSFSSINERPRVHGKFLYRGNAKLWIRGVTYGTFRPNLDGDQFPPVPIVQKDFSQISAPGFNAIRT